RVRRLVVARRDCRGTGAGGLRTHRGGGPDRDRERRNDAGVSAASRAARAAYRRPAGRSGVGRPAGSRARARPARRRRCPPRRSARATSVAPALLPGESVSLGLRVPEVLEAIRHARASGTSQRAEFFQRVPVDRWYEAIVTPILSAGADSRPGLLLLAFHDLT